jgi:hypothetical protein
MTKRTEDNAAPELPQADKATLGHDMPPNVRALSGAWVQPSYRISKKILAMPKAELSIDETTGEIITNPWHDARAKGVQRYVYKRLQGCGACGHIKCQCRCKGHYVLTRCGSPFCLRCTRLKLKRLRAQLRSSFQACADQRPKAFFHLWTLTIAHSGDMQLDRDRLKTAWERLRAWVWDKLGEAPPFATRWECTNGTRGRGHVHIHVAIHAPFLPYREVRKAWIQATNGLSTQFDSTPQGQRTPDEAAKYLSKYAGKSEPPLNTSVAVAWAEVMYGQRRTTTSEAFWAPVVCQECLAPWKGPDGTDAFCKETWDACWPVAPEVDPPPLCPYDVDAILTCSEGLFASEV